LLASWQLSLGRYSVIIIGAKPRLSYVLLSLLAGEVGEAAIELKRRGWWNGRGMTTLDWQAVDLADVAAMHALMRPCARAAVIGGGLLGLEAAYGLARACVKVTLVHLMDRLMERQLDHCLKRAIEAMGVEVLLGADTTGFWARIARPVSNCPADASSWSARSALGHTCKPASWSITASPSMTGSSDPDIFALGECAQHRNNVYGPVEPAYEQAKVLARRLGDTLRRCTRARPLRRI
jgi:nitrite reductase (NADH) large subunit